MAQSLLSILFLFLGLCWGFLCLSRTLVPVFATIPRLKEIRDYTKLEEPMLLYTLLRNAVIWATLLVFSIVLVMKFFPQFRAPYAWGFCIALFYMLMELRWEYRQSGSKFMDQLRASFLPQEMDKETELPTFSSRQMGMLGWNCKDLTSHPFTELDWDCAYCNSKSKISESEVILRGNANHFVVECLQCRKKFVIRVTGLLPSDWKAEAVASLPEFSGT